VSPRFAVMCMTPDLDRSTGPEARPGVRASWGSALEAVAPVLVLVLLLFLDFPLCPSRNLFGVPCPGCGLTRATEALFAGDLARALALHPLVPLILPVVAWMLLRTTLVSAGLLRSDSFDPLARLPRWLWIALGVVLVGTWVVRMAAGWLPDPVDPSQGLIGRGLVWMGRLF